MMRKLVHSLSVSRKPSTPAKVPPDEAFPRKKIGANVAEPSPGVDQTSELCERCTTIDIDSILRLDLSVEETREKGLLICELGRQWKLGIPETCPLCRLFAHVYRPYRYRTYGVEPPDTLTLLNPKIRLEARSASTSLTGIPGAGDSVFLTVIAENDTRRFVDWVFGRHGGSVEGPLAYIAINDPSKAIDPDRLAGLRVDPHQIDYRRIKEWISICKEYHGGECTGEGLTRPRGFKVIDCATHRVVQPPDQCEYVALSYVWGKTSQQSGDIDNVLTGAPRVVANALEVASRLGYQYLWIDRYCIDAENAAEKHDQIRNMDLIYRGADLTIIAAAGKDATFGLPGVGGVPRIQQPSVQLGPWLLTASLPDIGHEINKSVWASRAWTFQEGLLPFRRLVFTEHEVYFQCWEFCCTESVNIPMRLVAALEKVNYTTYRATDNVFPRGVGKGNSIGTLMAEYYRKHISYKSDKIGAIRGILKYYEKLNSPLLHLCGLPVLLGQIWTISPFPRQTLEWCICRSLFWYVDGHNTTKRLETFPSWSWAGWDVDEGKEGELCVELESLYTLSEIKTPAEFKRIPLTIEVEMNSGKSIPLTRVLEPQEISLLKDSDFFFLKLRSWSIDCTRKWSLKGWDFEPWSPELKESMYFQDVRWLVDQGSTKISGISQRMNLGKSKQIYKAIVVDIKEFRLSWPVEDSSSEPEEESEEGEQPDKQSGGQDDREHEEEAEEEVVEDQEENLSVNLSCLIIQNVGEHYERVGKASLIFMKAYSLFQVGDDGTGYLDGRPVLSVEQVKLG